MAGGSTSSTTSPARSHCSLAADLGEQYEDLYDARLTTIESDDGEHHVPIAILPSGKRVESLKKYIDEYATQPERRAGTATLRDLASFIAHVNRFKSADSSIFADPNPVRPSLTAVFDYHPGGPDVTAAAFGRHRSVYAAPVSEEWKAWIGINGKPLAQGEFAAFLEDHVTEVLVADESDEQLKAFADLVGGRFANATQLLALSRGLQVNVDTQVREVVTLSSGEIDIKYAEQHRDGEGQPIKVANLFVIAIPVFYGGATYRIPARLRYRVQGGRITWSVHLVRVDRVFDDAFHGAIAEVQTKTDLPIFVGSPEA